MIISGWVNFCGGENNKYVWLGCGLDIIVETLLKRITVYFLFYENLRPKIGEKCNFQDLVGSP